MCSIAVDRLISEHDLVNVLKSGIKIIGFLRIRGRKLSFRCFGIPEIRVEKSNIILQFVIKIALALDKSVFFGQNGFIVIDTRHFRAADSERTV